MVTNFNSMNKKLKLVVMALCVAPALMAQEVDSLGIQDEQAFTFTEAQLGEDDDMSQNVTIINSNSNTYALSVQSHAFPLPCF